MSLMQSFQGGFPLDDQLLPLGRISFNGGGIIGIFSNHGTRGCEGRDVYSCHSPAGLPRGRLAPRSISLADWSSLLSALSTASGRHQHGMSTPEDNLNALHMATSQKPPGIPSPFDKSLGCSWFRRRSSLGWLPTEAASVGTVSSIGLLHLRTDGSSKPFTKQDNLGLQTSI